MSSKILCEMGSCWTHWVGVLHWSSCLLSINSLWPSDAIWRQRSGSTLAQVMACCLMAPSHYLNQCWLIISEVQRHSPGGWINIKMSSYQYRKSHCGDKTILRPSYLHNGISYTGKTSLYWIGALEEISWEMPNHQSLKWTWKPHN